MDENSNKIIERPTPFYKKPIKPEWKEFTKSIGKAAANFFLGSRDNVAADLAEAAVAMGLSTQPTEIAWRLIYNALIKSVIKLIKENDSRLDPKPDEKSITDLFQQIDNSLNEGNFIFDSSLFEKPQEMSILDPIRKVIMDWSKNFGLVEWQSRSICFRLPSYFIFALQEEWSRDSNSYKILLRELENPFIKAGERERVWLRYSLWLQQQVAEPMYGESFSISEVYVPLRAYYEEKINKGKKQCGHLDKVDKCL